MPPTALGGAYGTARDMPLPMPHPRQPALVGTAGAEWAVCCCVSVVTTAFDHASTTDGTDVLGIVGSVVVFGWGGHEWAARWAASCRQDDT